MAGSREIRNKIKSVKNTQKITRAMEMVAASKMRKAQDRMKKARPYGEKIRNVAAHMSRANTEYRHPFLIARDTVKRIGIIIVTSDKGLCGGLNTNVLRKALNQMKAWQAEGEQIEVCCIGNKGLGFMSRVGASVTSQVVGLGDTPDISRLIGAVKVVLDGYTQDQFDRVYIFYNRFINTMKQEPVMEQLLPLTDDRMQSSEQDSDKSKTTWDYIYEPEAKPVIDDIMVRYVEALI
ncbi:MAG: ATP synthase F1 subunit gamma, partial [Nitrosomonas sp.]|nr:ATP synthase F1 subunit gamma [Nitrosomonas sp.]